MTTKKTTKKTTSSSSSSSSPSGPPSDSRAPARRTDLPPAPRATATPSEPEVEVRPYKHIGDQADAFLAEHPNGVYFHLDAASKHENESAIKSIDPKRPVFVDGRSFLASELIALGFDVFQNGPGGKLIGTRGV